MGVYVKIDHDDGPKGRYLNQEGYLMQQRPVKSICWEGQVGLEDWVKRSLVPGTVLLVPTVLYVLPPLTLPWSSGKDGCFGICDKDSGRK